MFGGEELVSALFAFWFSDPDDIPSSWLSAITDNSGGYSEVADNGG